MFLLTSRCVLKYKCLSLLPVLRSRLPHFDINLILAYIKVRLDRLHGLGLVHDDINPSNVMLDDGGHGVIIGFDSSAFIGAKSRGGAPGWSTRRAPPGTRRLTVKTSPRLPGGDDAGSSIHLENVRDRCPQSFDGLVACNFPNYKHTSYRATVPIVQSSTVFFLRPSRDGSSCS